MENLIEEKTLLLGTLCFLKRRLHGGQICLPVKNLKIGAGKRNGYGGGPENGESIEVAAVRELQEESNGVTTLISCLERIAVVDFHNTKADGSTFTCRVHSFITYQWTGVPEATPEMGKPEWFEISNLPFDQMMPADRFWLPLALEGKKVYGQAWYGPHQEELLRPMELKVLSSWREIPVR